MSQLATTTTVSAIIQLMIMTTLIKENIVSRVGVAIYLGTSVGFFASRGLNDIWAKNISKLVAGDIILIVPLILGFLLFFRLYRKFAFISRYPSAILLGSNTGLSIAGIAVAQIYLQVLGTARVDTLNQAILAVWVLLVILYFIMTFESKGGFGYATRTGRMLLMITFGVGAGGFVVARFNQMISRFIFFLFTWLGLG